MTTAQMLADVRTKLDEASAGYWTDTEIYKSLNNGQIFTLNALFGSDNVSTCIKSLTVAYSTSSEPSDLLKPIGVTLNSSPCLIRSGDKQTKENNTYLTGSTSQPYVYFYSGFVSFDPTPTTGTYTIDYYKVPEDMTSLVEPTLREPTHPAIVQYAFADLLLKDEKHQESVVEFQKYEKMVANL